MALRAALTRWRGLAASSLLYGALITAGVVTLNIFLRTLRLDLSNYRFVRDDAGSLLSALLIHGLALLPPEPGAPFDELLTVQRFLLSRARGAYFGVGDDAPRILGAEVWATGAVAVLALITIETALCLRTALVMDGAPDGWLRATLRLARAHFWRVLTLRWGLRLFSVALVVAGSTLPTLLQQAVFFPMVLRAARSYWPFALNSGLALLGVTLPLMLLNLLAVVFEARLYLALTAPSATQPSARDQ